MEANLKQGLESDLKQAIKDRDDIKRSVIRMVMSAVHNAEIAKRDALEDPDIIGIIAKEAKQRNESIEAFRQGNAASILTLYHIFNEAEDSFIYARETSLKKAGKEMEIDILCLADGRVTIGEAKMGKLIKDRDYSRRDEFEKYKILAKEIRADRVIFSTLSDGFYKVPLAKIERFGRELAEEGLESLEVDILSGPDLMKISV